MEQRKANDENSPLLQQNYHVIFNRFKDLFSKNNIFLVIK